MVNLTVGRSDFPMAKSFIELRIQLFNLLLLTFLSAVVLFPALGQNRHWASHEIRHAEIIREMAESGNYLIPRLFGEVYYDKPPVMHAMAAFLTRLVGEPSILIARLPSAVAGTVGALAIYGIGLLLFDRRIALLSAIVLLGMPGYTFMARHVRPDMVFCAIILLSCLCFGLGMKRHQGIHRLFFFILAGLLAGLGVITKGPYGVIFPLFFAVLTPFRRQDFNRPTVGWIGFILGVTIALAIWAIPAYLYDNGEYLHKVIFQPDLDVSKGDAEKSVFWYFKYVFTFTLPSSLFLPFAFIDLRRRGYSAPLAVAVAIFIVISCVSKKRQHYLIPLYPFLALGISAFIMHHSNLSNFIRRAAWVLIPLSIATTPVNHLIVQPLTQPYKNSKMCLIKDILEIIEPNSYVYCAANVTEELAWVGRQYERIRNLSVNSSASQILRQPESKSYLVVDEENLKLLLNVAEPFTHEQILSRTIDHKKIILFRLNESVPGIK